MSARRGTDGSDPGFWTKMLSAAKVRRILQRRGFDPEAFRRDYEQDRSRASRASRRPTDREISAVEAFQRTGDHPELMQALGTRNRATADSAIRRVLAWKARGGVKTIRRKPAASIVSPPT